MRAIDPGAGSDVWCAWLAGTGVILLALPCLALPCLALPCLAPSAPCRTPSIQVPDAGWLSSSGLHDSALRTHPITVQRQAGALPKEQHVAHTAGSAPVRGTPPTAACCSSFSAMTSPSSDPLDSSYSKFEIRNPPHALPALTVIPESRAHLSSGPPAVCCSSFSAMMSPRVRMRGCSWRGCIKASRAAASSKVSSSSISSQALSGRDPAPSSSLSLLARAASASA